MKSWVRKFIKHERIYCFPNQYGFVGFALFLVMVATGATYQNNLVYMMAFLFLSLGLIAILQTARNIRGLEITSVDVKAGFPGEDVDVEVHLKNPNPEIKLNIEVVITIESQKVRIPFQLIEGQSFRLDRGRIKLPNNRGVYQVGRVGINTTYPYLLFRAWKYSKIKSEVLVFPVAKGGDLNQELKSNSKDEFSGHKKYENGDSQARVDWKLFSRRNDLYVRQYLDGSDQEVLLNWESTGDLNFEDRLSQLSFWIVKANQKSIQYQLRLPNFNSGVGTGDFHYLKCMEALTRQNNAA